METELHLFFFLPQHIEILRELYDDVDDIDLLAGIWLERPMHGGITPPTFFCLTIQQLVRNVVSDRHWYERPNRPNAFTFRKYLFFIILYDNVDDIDLLADI